MVTFILAGGWVMFVLIALCIPLLATAVKFARNASAQRLSLVRTLTTAITFAAIGGVVCNVGVVAKNVAENVEWMKEPLPYLLAGFSEAITPAVLAFPVVAIAWILVSFGVRRMPHE